MKILYLSCHEILEYDELKLFTELGHECYSLGAYTIPGGQEGRKRPALDLPYNPEFVNLALQYDKFHLHPEQLEGIDVIIVMHEPGVLTKNWPLFKEFIRSGGRVIWRSIGQSVNGIESQLIPLKAEGLELVRYSPKESLIPGFAGEDAMIRFYKDPEEFKDWNGGTKQVINFTQSLKKRDDWCGYEVIIQATEGFPRKIYGPGNEDLGEISGGLLSYEDQKKALRDNRVYFYHGTWPAPYTLSFIEAMMTGIPIVAVGPKLGNSEKVFPGYPFYEVDDFLGYSEDEIDDFKTLIGSLMNDDAFSEKVSYFQRRKAIKLFGKSEIKHQWHEFLEG